LFSLLFDLIFDFFFIISSGIDSASVSGTALIHQHLEETLLRVISSCALKSPAEDDGNTALIHHTNSFE